MVDAREQATCLHATSTRLMTARLPRIFERSVHSHAGGGRPGNREPERRALAELRAHPDLAAVRGDELLADVEPEAEAAALARAALPVALEQMGHELGRD